MKEDVATSTIMKEEKKDPQTAKYKSITEENNRKIKCLISTVDDVKKFADRLEKKLEKQKFDNDDEKALRKGLEDKMANLRNDTKQKNNLIKELTAKLNRKSDKDFDREYDAAKDKLQQTRMENNSLKMENLKLQENNEKLAREMFCIQERMKILNHDDTASFGLTSSDEGICNASENDDRMADDEAEDVTGTIGIDGSEEVEMVATDESIGLSQKRKTSFKFTTDDEDHVVSFRDNEKCV